MTPKSNTAGGPTAFASGARFKQITAAVATLVILGVAVFAFRGRNADPAARATSIGGTSLSERANEAKPADVVFAMFDAARAGNMDAYLECFAGAARGQIEEALQESLSRERFAAQLRGSLARLKGFAVLGARERSSGVVEMAAERVFDGYTETLAVEVTRTEAGWKITSLETTGREANRYGQPAVSMPEE